jgi:hypothetical protein
MTINQIIGNRKTESKIDTGLWKKLNEKYSEIENTKKEETKPINHNLKKILQYDTNGKPVLKLISLEKTVIHTPTQKDYDTLMQIYETGNWWNCLLNEVSTDNNFLSDTKKDTCIKAEQSYSYDSKEYYEKIGLGIISTKQFYNIQKITPKMIQELNEWYDTNKPNRKSKG